MANPTLVEQGHLCGIASAQNLSRKHLPQFDDRVIGIKLLSLAFDPRLCGQLDEDVRCCAGGQNFAPRCLK